MADKLAAQRPAAVPPLCCTTCGEHLRVAPDPHAPVLLHPCGHSVCGLCAEVIVRPPPPASAAQCPICSEKITLNFPNSALGALAEAAFAAYEPPAAVVLCADCVREREEDETYDVSPASHECAQCGKLLCEAHQPAHGKRKGHSVVRLPSAAGAPPTHCPAHAGTPLSLFCYGDKRLICAMCTLTTHRGYAFVDVAQARQDLSASVRALAGKCESGAGVLLKGAAIVGVTQARLTSAKDATVAQLAATVASVKQELDKYESGVRQRVLDIYTARMKALEAQADALAVTAEQLMSAVGVCAAAVRDGSPVLLAQAQEDCGKMSALAKDFAGPVEQCILDIAFSPRAVLDGLASLSTLILEATALPVPVEAQLKAAVNGAASKKRPRTYPIQVIIKTASRSIALDVKPADTVESVKSAIQDREGVPVELQRLVYSGRELANELVLEALDLQPGSTLLVLMRAGGADSMQLRVKVGQRVMLVPFGASDTVLDIKARALAAMRCSKERQGLCRLSFDGLPLEDSQALRSYGISSYDLVSLSMQITAVLVSGLADRAGCRILLDFIPHDTVRVLKEQIQGKAGIPPEEQCLIHAGKVMLECQTLMECKVEPAAELKLVVRLVDMPEDLSS